MADEGKDYEVVDKRKVRLNEEGEPEITEQAAEPEQKAEEPEQAAEEQVPEEEFKLPPVDVDSLIKSFIGILGAHAWQWMGLVKDPMTGEIEKDLSQAKMAIDTLATLISSIQPRLQPGEMADLQGMLSDLRMNFVRQSTQG